jgi:hypothetical protein
MAKWLAFECESCTVDPHFQHKMFTIVLLTIYLDKAPSVTGGDFDSYPSPNSGLPELQPNVESFNSFMAYHDL